MDGEADTTGADGAVIEQQGDEQSQARDFDAEARAHGWTPKEEFRGDPSKWVDAETFAKRADEVMPFLKKQNAGLKKELDDLKRQVKQASAHFSKVEERAYQRAMSDLQAEHDEAVESGDVAAGRRVLKKMDDLKAEVVAPVENEPDPAEARKELNAWIEKNDWYVLDDGKRRYADLQAETMGPAKDWEGGQQAWLSELERRVTRKFADPKVNPVNGGGNRGAPGGGGKSYNDLPAPAKAMCDKWVKTGLIKSRDDYVKSYDWS